MKRKSKIKFYGTEQQEVLDNDPEETVFRLMEDIVYVDFPIIVYEYKHTKITESSEALSQKIIDNILEDIDENFGNPDNDYTEPTPNMKEASFKLAEVLMNEYVVWNCDMTGVIFEYTKEEALKILDKEEIQNENIYTK